MTNDQDQQQPAHEPMTAARLAAIRARAEAATPGPWEDVYGDIWDANGWLVEVRNEDRDAAFIAHARQDVPDLLAFVEAALPILRAVAIYPDFTDQDLGIGLLRMQARALMAGTGESADEGGES